jgi:dihydroorotate dehydrogenase
MWYRLLGPLVRLLPPEMAHAVGLKLLQLPLRYASLVNDPWTWQGLTFRNKVGIAAGFDKNAVALDGLERLGVGFVEIGTVLVEPWPGNDKPRLERLYPQKGIWNRLGFPSDGVKAVIERLERYPKDQRRGMLVFSNIGPHPGHLKSCTTPEAYLLLAREELLHLVKELAPHSDGFVINLSSPNTQGLRGLLSDPRLAQELVLPIREAIAAAAKQQPYQPEALAREAHATTPLLMKLPPDDPDKQAWTEATLRPVLEPLLKSNVCDGFVAVNTSTRLTQSLLNRDLGGVSGGPLLPLAKDCIKLLRSIIGQNKLIIGCGGITQAYDAVQLQQAGAELVELYSGMIFAGPTLPASCAAALHKMMS